MATAAALSGLKSLGLVFGVGNTGSADSMINVADILLPLTGVEDLCNSLEKLHLAAEFAPAPLTSSSSDWHLLHKLRCLRELSISYLGYGCRLLALPVDSLPSTLEVFKGHYLNLERDAPPVSSFYICRYSSPEELADPVSEMGTCTKEVQDMLSRNGASGDETATNESGLIMPTTANRCSASHCPDLHTLYLAQCRLCEPQWLASKQLKTLVVDQSSWPGGFQAAAVAWPCVQELVYWFLDYYVELWGDSEGREYVEAVVNEVMHDLCIDFTCLTSLMVQHLPYIDTDMLELVGDKLTQLQRILLAVLCTKETQETLTDAGSEGQMQRWLQQKLPWAVDSYVPGPESGIDQHRGLAIGFDPTWSL